MPLNPKKQEKCCTKCDKWMGKVPNHERTCLSCDCHKPPEVTIEPEKCCGKCKNYNSNFTVDDIVPDLEYHCSNSICSCHRPTPELKQEGWEEKICNQTNAIFHTHLLNDNDRVRESFLQNIRYLLSSTRQQERAEIIKKIEGMKKSNYRREKEVKERKLNTQQSKYLMAEYHGFNQALEDVIKEIKI